jgi:hypothetical protein
VIVHRFAESDEMKTAIKNLLVGPFVRVLLLAILTIGAPSLSSAAVFVSVNLAPPLLPVYTQPFAPGPGYIWTPGYWAYGPDGYYWVPGMWVLIPFVGALWTPGYWGWGDGSYVWHAGYWGRHVGFYGGVDYGFGYSGAGYQGGRWNNGTFMYNTAVNNINRTNIHNTYDQPVIGNANATRVSYNGGSGGLSARPTAEERLAEHDEHRAAMPAQLQHEQAAKSSRGQLASVNRAAPAVTATAKQPAIGNHHAVGTTGPAHATVAKHTPPVTATAKQPANENHHAVGTMGPAHANVSNHTPPVGATAKQPANENHHVVGAMGPAHANVANHPPPAVAATAKPVPTREHASVGAREPVSSAIATNRATTENANPRLASSHASNVSIRPSGGAPHAQNEVHPQGPSQGGHGGGEHREEGAKGQ